MNRDAAIEIIRSSRVSHGSEELIALMQESIRIHARPTRLDSLALGASRLSGLPDLPAGVEWPGDLAFIGQVRLEDLACLNVSIPLPSRGTLYFFYDGGAWGDSLQDKAGWRVLYGEPSGGKPLRTVRCRLAEDSRHTCEPTPQAEGTLRCIGDPGLGDTGHTCELTFDREWTLPYLWNLDADEDEWEGYSELLLRLYGNPSDNDPIHRMLGYPQVIQDEMELECQLASSRNVAPSDWSWDVDVAELASGVALGGPGTGGEALQAAARDWLLLLQIDTDEENAGWMWGDCGRIYFWIRKQDLAKRRFDDVWLIKQCY